MDTTPTGPQPASAPPPHACPHCGAGGCGVADPAADNVAMLGVLARIGTAIVAAIGQRFEASGGRLEQDDALVFEIVSRSVRKTIALRGRLYADSRKTPEQLAAEQVRRAEAAERARLREKRDKVGRGLRRIVDTEPGLAARENLLSDMRERLLDPDIDIALTQQDVTAIVLGICKDFGIVPRNEIWSHAALRWGISEADAQLRRDEAERAAGLAAVAAGADWREGVEFSSWPANQATAGAAGPPAAPPDRPQSEWPPDILGDRPPPDLTRGRRPPDTG